MFPRRVFLSFTAVIAAAAVSVWAVTTVADAELRVVAHGPVLRANPNTVPFQGLGAWIDIFDKTSWKDPGATIADLGAHGVRTLYLQTSNDSQKRSIMKGKGVIAFLDSAHSAGIRVVAWYLPGFVDTGLDLRRIEAAISLRTPAGNSFDGFGLDIESPEVADPMLRTARLLQLSDQIRAFAGEGYALGAIIPSPHGMTVHAGYWPNFPYQELALRYDAFLPMAYFTWRDKSTIGAAGYIAANLQILRTAVGSDEVPVHIIGGIAQESALVGVEGFANAARRGGVIGESLYSYPGVTGAMWAALSQPASPSPPASASASAAPTSPGNS